MTAEMLQELSRVMEELELPKVIQLTKDALAQGWNPHEIIIKGLQAGIIKVGERYERGEYFVPELLRSAKAMEAAMELIKPHLKEGDEASREIRAVLGTVKGDIHHIGKGVVKLVLEANGVKVIDLGVDVPSARFIEEAKRIQAQIIGLSALMTTTLPRMKEVVDMAKEQGLRDEVKIIIGGAPADETYARTIGADGFGKDAVSAVRLVKALAIPR